MAIDPKPAYDGHSVLWGCDASRRGAVSGRVFSGLSVNLQYREGKVSTRPPYSSLDLTGDREAIEVFKSRAIRGGKAYNSVRKQYPASYVVACGTDIISARLVGKELDLSFVKRGLSPRGEIVYMEQAENYMFFQNGVDAPFAWNGLQLTEIKEGTILSDGTEIIEPMPIGTFMKYAHGRIWMFDLNGLLRASDHLYSHGLQETAPLSLGSFAESTYPNSGDGFSAPAYFGNPVSIQAIPRHPSVNGHGELLVMHELGFYSVDPSLPRNLWAENSIQSVVLTGRGCLGHRSPIAVNGDIWYRSSDLSASSFKHSVVSTRDSWGDKSLSREVQRFLDYDSGQTAANTKSLKTKNRLLMTCAHESINSENEDDPPHKVALGLVSADFDPGSAANPERPFGWDGLWTGLRIVDMDTVISSSDPRHIFISYDSDGENRFYELLEKSKLNDSVDGQVVKIKSFYTMEDLFSQLNTASEIYSKEILASSIGIMSARGKSKISIQYKPNFSINWSNILSEEEFGLDPEEITQDEIASKQAIFYGQVNSQSPNDDFDEITLTKSYKSDAFDIKVIVEGSVDIYKMQVQASVALQDDFYSPSVIENGSTGSLEAEETFSYKIK